MAALQWTAGSGIWKLGWNPTRLDLTFDAAGFAEISAGNTDASGASFDCPPTLRAIIDRVSLNLAEVVRVASRPVNRLALVVTGKSSSGVGRSPTEMVARGFFTDSMISSVVEGRVRDLNARVNTLGTLNLAINSGTTELGPSWNQQLRTSSGQTPLKIPIRLVRVSLTTFSASSFVVFSRRWSPSMILSARSGTPWRAPPALVAFVVRSRTWSATRVVSVRSLLDPVSRVFSVATYASRIFVMSSRCGTFLNAVRRLLKSSSIVPVVSCRLDRKFAASVRKLVTRSSSLVLMRLGGMSRLPTRCTTPSTVVAKGPEEAEKVDRVSKAWRVPTLKACAVPYVERHEANGYDCAAHVGAGNRRDRKSTDDGARTPRKRELVTEKRVLIRDLRSWWCWWNVTF